MEYHKIETLYKRDEATHRLKPELIFKNPVYAVIDPWEFTEKIDGTNIRLIWEHSTPERAEAWRIGGKTDNAQIHADLFRWIQENVNADKLRSIFPETDAIIYGEGYGAGIQKGGGDYSQTKKLIVFDVLVGGKWWLNWEAVKDVASKMGLETVPFFGTLKLADATEIVREGFQSALNGGKAKAEGLVGRPTEALFDKKGHRVIVKLKTKDF